MIRQNADLNIGVAFRYNLLAFYLYLYLWIHPLEQILKAQK